jgi:hypothetical protein
MGKFNTVQIYCTVCRDTRPYTTLSQIKHDSESTLYTYSVMLTYVCVKSSYYDIIINFL